MFNSHVFILGVYKKHLIKLHGIINKMKRKRYAKVYPPKNIHPGPPYCSLVTTDPTDHFRIYMPIDTRRSNLHVYKNRTPANQCKI